MRPPAAARPAAALDAARSLALSQAALGVCLLVCVAIEPSYLFSLDQGGISNFGTLTATVVPFSVGFAAAAAGAALAAVALPAGSRFARASRTLLGALAVLYVLAFATAYRYQETGLARAIHETVVISLFLFMLVAAAWLSAGPGRSVPGALAWLSVVSAGFLFGALTYFGWLHVLFTAQLRERDRLRRPPRHHDEERRLSRTGLESR